MADPRGFPTSLPEFQRVFPSDAACATYLESLRWPDGFACPKCGEIKEPYRFTARPGVLRCRGCRVDVSLTAGTVMHSTHTPLSTWFWAAYLVTIDSTMTGARLRREIPEITRDETVYAIRRALVASGRGGWRGLNTALGIEPQGKRGPKPVDPAKRFARYVVVGKPPLHRPELGPCHLWTGARCPNNYGRFSLDGHSELATHVAWRLAHGVAPKQCLLHHCDNPPCVKALADEFGPAHLFEGTRPENTADMVRKGRGTPPRFSPAEQAAIVARYRAGGVRRLSQRSGDEVLLAMRVLWAWGEKHDEAMVPTPVFHAYAPGAKRWRILVGHRIEDHATAEDAVVSAALFVLATEPDVMGIGP